MGHLILQWIVISLFIHYATLHRVSDENPTIGSIVTLMNLWLLSYYSIIIKEHSSLLTLY